MTRHGLNLRPSDRGARQRAVWADAEPHQARVDHVTDRGPVVLDEPPPRGSGMPLTHLVTWDRVIGRADD